MISPTTTEPWRTAASKVTIAYLIVCALLTGFDLATNGAMHSAISAGITFAAGFLCATFIARTR
jgi:hypothetical protein